MAPKKNSNNSRIQETNRIKDHKSVPYKRPVAIKSRPNGYSRKFDCWNCGMKDHQKERCPFPSSLKCSFCQKRGVRSDQCSCHSRKNYRTFRKTENKNTLQEKIETGIFVQICRKTVIARLNPSVQETYIGEAIANLVKIETGRNSKKLIIRPQGTCKMVYYMNFKMNTRATNEISVDGIIDPKLTEKGVVLGMRAIRDFGFKFFVGGQLAKVRTSVQAKCSEAGRDKTRNNAEEEMDEDRMSFLDEEEAKKIREWKY